MEQILRAIENAKAKQDDRPSVIILDTVKGKGYRKIENQLSSHNMPLTMQMVDEALAELDKRLEEIEAEEVEA